MSLPSSGQLSLKDIYLEIYTGHTTEQISLGTLSNNWGFSEPHNVSDFYNFNAYFYFYGDIISHTWNEPGPYTNKIGDLVSIGNWTSTVISNPNNTFFINPSSESGPSSTQVNFGILTPNVGTTGQFRFNLSNSNKSIVVTLQILPIPK